MMLTNDAGSIWIKNELLEWTYYVTKNSWSFMYLYIEDC